MFPKELLEDADAAAAGLIRPSKEEDFVFHPVVGETPTPEQLALAGQLGLVAMAHEEEVESVRCDLLLAGYVVPDKWMRFRLYPYSTIPSRPGCDPFAPAPRASDDDIEDMWAELQVAYKRAGVLCSVEHLELQGQAPAAQDAAAEPGDLGEPAAASVAPEGQTDGRTDTHEDHASSTPETPTPLDPTDRAILKYLAEQGTTRVQAEISVSVRRDAKTIRERLKYL